jgi:hypothetical protein
MKMRVRRLFAWGVITASLLTRCAGVSGRFAYEPPDVDGSAQPTRVFDAPPDAVWRAVVAHVGDTFFVIDNMEKDSFFLNLSFSAKDPAEYIDCGQVTSDVTNARGPRHYSFPGASAAEEYEATDAGHLYFVSRQMGLTGKVNLLLTALGPSQTRMKVTARYVVRKTAVERTPMDIDPPRTLDTTLSFSTGELAQEPTGMKMQCRGTLALETSILDGTAAKLSTLRP